MFNLNFKEKNGGALCDKAFGTRRRLRGSGKSGRTPGDRAGGQGIFGELWWRKSIYLGHSPGLEDMNFIDVRNFGRFIFTGRSGKSAAVCSRAAGISGV